MWSDDICQNNYVLHLIKEAKREQLKTLDLSHNQLTSLPESIKNFSTH